jgi:CRP-like cAMP-binding protein
MAQGLNLKTITIPSGSYIVIEGKRDNRCFYIIKNGQVRAFKNIEVVRFNRDGILTAGDFFGVVSTMCGLPEIETVQAVTNVTLIEVSREQFPELVIHAEPVAMKILLQLSAWVRFLMTNLAKTSKMHLLTQAKEPEPDETALPGGELFKTSRFYEERENFRAAFYAARQYAASYPDGASLASVKLIIETYQEEFGAALPVFNDSDWTRVYPAETMIFAQGEVSADFYIINRGTVRLTRIHENEEILLNTLKAGDIFGEMSFLEDKEHSSNAFTLEETELMIVDKENFGRINRQNPQIAMKLATLLSGHVWFWYKQLTNRKLSDPVAQVYDITAVLLERQRVPVNKKPFRLNIGAAELLKMVSIGEEERKAVWTTIERDDFIRTNADGLLVVPDVELLVRRTEQLWKIQRFSAGTK